MQCGNAEFYVMGWDGMRGDGSALACYIVVRYGVA